MIDCFDGLVVSWTIGTRPDTDLVNTMLDAAIETVAECESRPVIHSDGGAHCRWPGLLSRMHNAKLIRSVSRKGCSPDNAAYEGFFSRLKSEQPYPLKYYAASPMAQFGSGISTHALLHASTNDIGLSLPFFPVARPTGIFSSLPTTYLSTR